MKSFKAERAGPSSFGSRMTLCILGNEDKKSGVGILRRSNPWKGGGRWKKYQDETR